MSGFTAELVLHRGDKLVRSFGRIDFLKFVDELTKSRIISFREKTDIANLDRDSVDTEMRSKYLLQLIIKSKYGKEVKDVCQLLLEDGRMGGAQSVEEVEYIQETDQCLTEKDTFYLVKVLVDAAHKWEEIGIALHIPQRVREDHKNKSTCILKLEGILNEWIAGNYLKPVTIGTLRSILAGPIVGCSTIANSLTTTRLSPTSVKSHPDLISQESGCAIVYQSMNVEVAYGKSTLLEVQVNFSSALSYKWVKDGIEIFDDELYQSTSSAILLVSTASQHVEGTYTCYIGNDITSSEISLVVKKYPTITEYFRNMYIYFQEVPRDSWPPKGTETFVELALIEREEFDIGDYDYSIQGNMDDILMKKAKLDYFKAFRKYESGALMLVEGRPGVGKTTLAQKITKDWALGNHILIGAKVVLLISLRVIKSKGKDDSLSTLFEIFYDDKRGVRSALHAIECDQGDGVCFMLDGLDEYQPYHKDQPTIIKKIIEKELISLTKSMVIVFSRPIGSAKLRSKVKVATRIEILGFTKEHIFDYVDRYFKSSDKAVALTDYLKLHFNVLHMCYLPVHTAMISFIFSQNEKEIPTTETKIYECFTMLTIIRKLKREDNNSIPPISFEELDENILKCFHIICQLAFEMATTSRQVFVRGDKDLQLSDYIGSDGPSLGLVIVDSTATLYRYKDFYAFLHLTFQEYLAAFHILHLDEGEQLKIIEQHQSNEAMLVVWKFYCGMKDFHNEKSFCQLQTLFRSTKLDFLHRIHYAFESQQPVVSKAALEGKKCLIFKNEYLTPADFNALMFAISTAFYPNSKLEFYSCKLSKEGMSYVLKAINSDRLKNVTSLLFHCQPITIEELEILNMLLAKLQGLEELNLSSSHLSKEEIQVLTKNVSLLHLKKLELLLPFRACSSCYEALTLLCFNSQVIHDIQCRYATIYTICSGCSEKLSSGTHSQVQYPEVHLYNKQLCNFDAFHACAVTFILTNCGIDDSILLHLLQSLKKCELVEKLVFDYNLISGRGAEQLAVTLQGCIKLKYFSARCNIIDNSGAVALANTLGKCPSLIYLNLECNSFGDQGAVAIAKVAAQLNITNVYLWNADITEFGSCMVLEYVSTANISSPSCYNFSGINVYDHKCLSRALTCCTSLPRIQLMEIGPKSAAALGHGLHSYTSLQALDVSYNSIYSEGAAALAGGLRSCVSLKKLNISYCSIGPEGASALAELKACTNLQTLDISGNGIGLKGIAGISNEFKYCINLQALNVSDNNIDSEVVVVLADSLKSCTNLQVLDISYNRICKDGAAVLVSGLMCCTNLQALNICRNYIGSEGAAALADGLKSYSILQKLDISRNNVCSEGAAALSKGLKYCISLKTLDISHNKIYSEGAVALSEGLKYCTGLQALNISDNNIHSKGATTLVYGLKSCSILQTLDISGNDIHSIGADLADGLRHCSNLQLLNISRNNFGSKCAELLADGLMHCINLITFDIGHNIIGSEGVAALADNLAFASLQTLDVSVNNIGSKGAAALAGRLKFGSILQALDISHNSIGAAGAVALASGLKSCSNLQKLNISVNNIGSEGAVALACTLKCCTNLQILDISYNNIGRDGTAALEHWLLSRNVVMSSTCHNKLSYTEY